MHLRQRIGNFLVLLVQHIYFSLVEMLNEHAAVLPRHTVDTGR